MKVPLPRPAITGHGRGDVFTFIAEVARGGTGVFHVRPVIQGERCTWFMNPEEEMPAYQGPIDGLDLPYSPILDRYFIDFIHCPQPLVEEVAWNLSVMRRIALSESKQERQSLIREVISSDNHIAARWAIGYLSADELIRLMKQERVPYPVKLQADALLTRIRPWDSRDMENKLSDWEESLDRAQILRDIACTGNYYSSKDAFHRLGSFFRRREKALFSEWIQELIGSPNTISARKLLALRKCCELALSDSPLRDKSRPALTEEGRGAITKLSETFLEALRRENTGAVRMAAAECLAQTCVYAFVYPQMAGLRSRLQGELTELLAKETDETVKKKLQKGLSILRTGPDWYRGRKNP